MSSNGANHIRTKNNASDEVRIVDGPCSKLDGNVIGGRTNSANADYKIELNVKSKETCDERMTSALEHVDDDAFKLKKQRHLVETKVSINQVKEYNGKKTTEAIDKRATFEIR